MPESSTSNVVCSVCGFNNPPGAKSCTDCGVSFARYVPFQDGARAVQNYAASETKKCPYCAEEIKADAIVCHFCKLDLRTGRSIAPPSSHTQPRTVQAQSGVMDGVKLGCGMFIVLPLIIIGCIIAFFILMAIVGSVGK